VTTPTGSNTTTLTYTFSDGTLLFGAVPISDFGAQESIYRSGLADGNIRFSVNITGGPAKSINEFRLAAEDCCRRESDRSCSDRPVRPARLIN
jgi:hypothetical protein